MLNIYLPKCKIEYPTKNTIKFDLKVEELIIFEIMQSSIRKQVTDFGGLVRRPCQNLNILKR